MASLYRNASTGLFVVSWLYMGKRFSKSHSTKVKGLEFKELVEADLKVAKARNVQPAFLAEQKPRKTSVYSNPSLESFWAMFTAHTHNIHIRQKKAI